MSNTIKFDSLGEYITSMTSEEYTAWEYDSNMWPSRFDQNDKPSSSGMNDKNRMGQGDEVVANILPIFDDHAVQSSEIAAEVNKIAVQGFVPQDAATQMKLNSAAGDAARFSNLPTWNLDKWISRSFKIGQFEWNTGMPKGHIQKFIFPDLIGEHSNQILFQILRRHFRNFFKGDFNVLLNSPNMSSGVVRFALIYESCGNPTDDEFSAMVDSVPSIEVAANEAGTYELEADAAWKDREWNVALTTSGNNSRQLYIIMKVISPLNVGEGGSNSLEIPLFMRIKNLMVAGLSAPLPIYPNFVFPQGNIFEAQGNVVNKPVQWVNDAMNAGAGLVGGVFQAGANITKPANELISGLKPILGAAGDVMSGGMGGLVGGFGDIGQMNYSGNQSRGLFQGRAVTNGTMDAAHVPTNTSSNFTELGNLSVIVDTIDWSTSDHVGDALVATAICPTFFNNKPTQILNRIARTSGRCRGDFKIEVRAVKNKFQTGRLLVYLKPAPDPNCVPFTGDNTNYSTFPLDLSNNEKVTIMVPYNGPKAVKEVSPIALAVGSDSTFSWGDFIVEVLAPLKSNSAESSSCPLIFKMSFCETFELYEPSNILVEGENYIVSTDSIVAMRRAYERYLRGYRDTLDLMLVGEMDARFGEAVGIDPAGDAIVGADLQTPMEIPIASDIEPICSLVSLLSKPKPIATIVVQPNTMDALTFYPHPKINLLKDDGTIVHYERTNELVNCYTHWRGGYNLDVVTTTTFSQSAMAAFGVLPFDAVLDELPDVSRETYAAGDVVLPIPNPTPFPIIPTVEVKSLPVLTTWSATGYPDLYDAPFNQDNAEEGFFYSNTPTALGGGNVRVGRSGGGSSYVYYGSSSTVLTGTDVKNVQMYWVDGVRPSVFTPSALDITTNRNGLYDIAQGLTFWLNISVSMTCSYSPAMRTGSSGMVIKLSTSISMFVEDIVVIDVSTLLFRGYAFTAGEMSGNLIIPTISGSPQYVQTDSQVRQIKAGTLYDTWSSLLEAQVVDLHQKRVEQNLNRLSNMRMALPFRSSNDFKDIPFNEDEEILYSSGYTLPLHQLYVANFSDTPIHVTLNISTEDDFRFFGFRGCRRPPLTTSLELGSSMMSPFVRVNNAIVSSQVLSVYKSLPKDFKKKYPLHQMLPHLQKFSFNYEGDAKKWKDKLRKANDHEGQMGNEKLPILLNESAFEMVKNNPIGYRLKFNESYETIKKPSYPGKFIDFMLAQDIVVAESVYKNMENQLDISQWQRRYRGRLIKFYGEIGLVMESFNPLSLGLKNFCEEMLKGSYCGHLIMSQSVYIKEQRKKQEMELIRKYNDIPSSMSADKEFNYSEVRDGVPIGILTEYMASYYSGYMTLKEAYDGMTREIKVYHPKWTPEQIKRHLVHFNSKLANLEAEMFSWVKQTPPQVTEDKPKIGLLQGFRETAQACSTFNLITEKLQNSTAFSYLSGMVDDPVAQFANQETARFLTARMAEITHYMMANKENKMTLLYSTIYHTLIDLGINYKSVFELAMKLVSYSSEETSTADDLEGQMGVHSTILLPLMAVGFGAFMKKDIPSFADSEKCLRYVNTRASTFNQAMRMSDNLNGLGIDVYNKYLSILEYWYGTNDKEILRARKLEPELPNLANWLMIVGAMQEEIEVHKAIREYKHKEYLDKLCESGVAYEIMMTENKVPPNLSRLVFDNTRKLRKMRDAVFQGRKGDLDRYSPFVLEMFGDTEVGKSFTLKKLTRDLGRYLKIDPHNLEYTRSFDTDHWDGYHNQFITSVDDFGQNTDDEEYKEFIVLTSPTRRVLPMASLFDKGCPFNSPVIFLSTNLPWHKPKTVYKFMAVWRRINGLIKANFIGERDAEGRPIYKDDMSHVEYQIYHPTKPGIALGEPMTYEKMRSWVICSILKYLKYQRDSQAKHDMALLQQYPDPPAIYDYKGTLVSGTPVTKIEGVSFATMTTEQLREYIRKNGIGQMMTEEDSSSDNEEDYAPMFSDIPFKDPHDALPTEFDPLQMRFGNCEWQHTDYMEAAYCLECNPIRPNTDSIYLRDSVKEFEKKGGEIIRGIFFPDRLCWQVLKCYENKDVVEKRKIWKQLIDANPSLSDLVGNEIHLLFPRGRAYGAKGAVAKFIDSMKSWIGSVVNRIVKFVTEHPLLSIIAGMFMLFGTYYITNKLVKKYRSKSPVVEDRESESKAYNQRNEPRVRGVVRQAKAECGVCRVTKKIGNYMRNKTTWQEVNDDFAEIPVDYAHPICTKIRTKLQNLYGKHELEASLEAVKITHSDEKEGETLILSSCPRIGFSRQVIEFGMSKLTTHQRSLLHGLIFLPCDEGCVCKGKTPKSVILEEAAREMAYGFATGESFVDNSLQDMIPVAKRNLMRWHVQSDGFAYHQNVFAIAGRLAVTNSHFVANIYPDDLIDAYMANGQLVQFRWRDNMWLNRDSCLSEQFDCAFVRLPVTFNAFKDLRHQFIKDSDLTRVEYQKGYMLTRTLQGDIERRDLDRLVYDTGSEYKIVGSRRGPTRYRTIKGLLYSTDTSKGDCGSILMLNNPNVPRKLLGFHCHGSVALAINGGQLVTQEMIAPFAEQIGTMMAEVKITPEMLNLDQDVRPLVKIPVGTNLEYIGIASQKYQIRIPVKTALRPSPIHGVFPPKKAPAVLSVYDERFDYKNNPTPLQRGVDGWSQTILPFYERHLDRVLPAMQRRQLFYLSKYRLPRVVLSMEEAINGFPWAHEMSQPIDMSTSPGLPYVKDRPSGEKGKKWLFEEFVDDRYPEYTLYRAGPILLEAIIARIDAYRRGEKPITVWYDMLKDELRDLIKIGIGNTRTFVIGPVCYTIVFRMFFYHYILALREMRMELSSKVGINPMGPEWTVFAKKLEGKNLIAGDYSKFDRTQRPECIVQFAHNANAFYDDGPENAKIRLFLIDEAFHRVTVCGNVLYIVNQGIPSGFCVTSDNNGSDGEINMGHTFLDIVETMQDDMHVQNAARKDLEYTMTDFYDRVELGTYGDDALMGVDPELEFFNFKNIQFSLGKFNITFTPEDKSDATDIQSRTLSEVTFLKRGFSKHHAGFYLAPLDKDTIQEEVNWVRSNENVPFLTAQVVDSAVRDAYHHGKEYFEFFQKKVNKALIDVGIAPNLLTYEDLDIQWKIDVGLPLYIGWKGCIY